MRRKIVFSAFFLSGMTALIYEVVWARLLTLIFGASIYGQSIALALFMGGLALGSRGAGWLSSVKPLSPLQWYAVLEGLIGVFGLASVTLPALCFPISTPSSTFDFIGRLLVCASLILPATAAMGATFPILYKVLFSEKEPSLTQISKLYLVNTLGAVLGIAVSSYWMIFSLGIQNTLFLAATVNTLLFLLLIGQKQGIEIHATPKSESSSPILVSTLGALFLCGMATMAYEVSWSRALCFSLGSSIYTFALILLAFLGGLALGAFWIEKKMPILHLRQTLCDLQTRIIIGAGVFTFLSLRLPLITERFFVLSQGIFWKVQLFEITVLFLIMAPVTVLIGASFPILCALLTQSGKPTETQIGSGYSVNTLGAIVGAMLTGFVFVPLLGPFHIFWITLAMHGLVLFLCAPPPKIKSLIKNFFMISIVVVFVWSQFQSVNTLDLMSGYYNAIYRDKNDFMPRYLAQNPTFVSSFAKRDPHHGEKKILWFRHGVTNSVAVVKNKSHTRLVIDGKTDASVGPYYESDMPTQSFLALLPLLYSQDQQEGLVVGLGSGVTAGILSLYTQQIDCLEIEKRVLEAAPYFKEYNFDVQNKANVRFLIDDARKVIRNSKKTYDFISAEPSNLWVAGVAQLFTQEYFEDCKRILKKEGVMVQWIHIYKLSCEDLKIAVHTFASVFPRLDIWGSFNFGDLFLVGWKDDSAHALSRERFNTFLKNYCYQKEMQAMSADTLESFLCFRLYSGKYQGKGPALHTDDRPILEYSAGKNMFSIEANKIFEWIEQELPQEGVPSSPNPLPQAGEDRSP
jgi:spermidine synthase